MRPGIWLVYLSFAAGTGSLSLVRYLWSYREKPGAVGLLGALSFQALWSVIYGVSLLVFDPSLRWLLEVGVWTAMAGEIVFFVVFALDYTGRDEILTTQTRRLWLWTPLLTATIATTNPLHHLAWTDFALTPAYGLATVTYTLRPWTLIGATGGVLLAGVGSLLLFETVLSYGSLYRREAIAVGVSTLPPVIALLAWLHGYTQVNYVTVAFLPHIALDAYAFVGSGMFEYNPATRRAGERSAIEDIGSPVIIVDEEGRIITMNAAAEDMLDAEKAQIQTESLAAHVDGVETESMDGERVELDTRDGHRTYSLNVTPLRGSHGSDLGKTVVFEDITDEIQREQRLSVLNRVLRHNLRNDLTVVKGSAKQARKDVDDESTAKLLDNVVQVADGLAELGEKARKIDMVLDDDVSERSVDVASLLSEIVAENSGADSIDVDVTVDATETVLDCDRRTLRLVVESLLENATDHAETSVFVTIESVTTGLAVIIEDDGPGIPEHEVAAIQLDEESDLDHASGLGLWLAAWGAQQLGGSLEFDTDGPGTRVTLTVPR